MSNFLQRIASTVIRPQVKLQPMQGSIFAPTNLSTSTPFSEHTEPTSHTVALGDFSSDLRIVQEADRASNLPVGKDRSLDPNSATPYATGMAGADTPLLPLRFERENVVSGSAGDIRSPADVQELNRGDVASKSLESQVANRPRTADPNQTLIVSQQIAPTHLQQAAPSPQASGQNTKSPASRRALSADREADEIHIHIGRIEVAAIAQAAPRPAAAPPRKTVNLDDYLRRGDGRAG